MNYAAVWHEATSRFCFCLEPGRFLFRVQTGKDDVKSVTLHSRDKYLPLQWKDTRLSTPMKRAACDGVRDYYEAELEFSMVCLRYCFELEDWEGNRVFYSNAGFTKELPQDIERLFDCPQTLREEERFQVPGWAANKVIYQIFPSRFATTREIPADTWYQAPITAKAELGGDLPGIARALPYLRELGVDVVYMTPIFRSHSSHKYDTIDYYTIDPSFGTEDDLCRLVERAHELGLRVILDGVFNHTSPEFFAFADLKENGGESRYRDWYYPASLPVNTELFFPNYKCFGYFGGMPKVNLRNPETAAYFCEVALYWLRKAHIDGWRLDVADEISHDFWRAFRKAVKAEFPDALIVGEIWHHAPDFLEGDQWDSVMNYPFYRAVQDFAAEEKLSASGYLGALGFQRGSTPTAAYPLLWNLIGSHDTPRMLHLCGEDRRRHRLAAALQLLQPGMPMIYYGDEVGMTGGKDPDCRRGMLWDPARQDEGTLRWYKTLLRLRKEIPAITQGRTIREEAMDDAGLIRITRVLGEETVTLVFHNQEGTVSLPDLAGKTDALTGTVFSGACEGVAALVLR